MTFLWPMMLLGLALIPLFVGIYLQMLQRRRWLVAQFGGGAPGLAGARGPMRLRRHIPPVLFLAALTILIVALARPETLVSLPRVEGTVILAFDVSGSMAADDLEPTRIEAAKAAARAFVERQPPSVQVGVVSFSEGGFATQAPTDDQAAILTAIERLGVQRGTSLGSGIDASLSAIMAVINPPLTLSDRDLTPAPSPTPVAPGTYKAAAIVLLTDGENTQAPDPLAAAQRAADRGIRIYTVGIGSAEGATLDIEGFTIRSRLDESTLQQIAQMTGGAYYNATNTAELRSVYDNLNPQLVFKPQKTEVTALFAGAGILVLLIGGTLSLLWLGRVP